MEPTPPQSEPKLTIAAAIGILAEQFPSLKVRDGRVRDEGFDNFAFMASERWVFLFPKSRQAEGKLLKAMRLLEELDGRAPLRIPRPEHWGRPSDAFPLAFVGYRMLPGVPADTALAPSHAQDRNGQLLGKLLGALHGFPGDHAAALGISVDVADPVDAMLAEVRALAGRLRTRLPERFEGACAPFIDGTVVRPPPPTGRPCLIHGDLQADHILLDAQGRVCGVIDFGDVTISDPLRDYAGLCAWQGWAFARAALAAAGREADAATEARIVFMARCLALIGLGWAGQHDHARLAACRRFLRQAFD